MNCHFVHTRLLFYLDHELSHSDRGAVEAHLGQCSSCQSLMDNIRSVYAQASEPVSPSDSFLERLSHLPSGEKPNGKHSLHFVRFVRRIAAAILLMLATTSLTLLYTSGQKHEPTQYASEEPFFEHYFSNLDEELADNNYYFIMANH